MSLSCRHNCKDHDVSKLPLSVRNNVKLSLSLHFLTSLEAQGGVVLPFSSSFQAFRSWSTPIVVPEPFTASPHQFSQLYSKGHSEWLDQMRHPGPSNVCSSPHPAVFYDLLMQLPTMQAHFAAIYTAARWGRSNGLTTIYGCLPSLQASDTSISPAGFRYSDFGSAMTLNYTVSWLYWSGKHNACDVSAPAPLYRTEPHVRLTGHIVLHRQMRPGQGQTDRLWCPRSNGVYSTTLPCVPATILARILHCLFNDKICQVLRSTRYGGYSATG